MTAVLSALDVISIVAPALGRLFGAYAGALRLLLSSDFVDTLIGSPTLELDDKKWVPVFVL